jgi:hypothetical protein
LRGSERRRHTDDGAHLSGVDVHFAQRAIDDDARDVDRRLWAVAREERDAALAVFGELVRIALAKFIERDGGGLSSHQALRRDDGVLGIDGPSTSRVRADDGPARRRERHDRRQ